MNNLSTNINTDLKRLTLLAWVFLNACAANPLQPERQSELADSKTNWTQCPEQRPEMCPQHYDPVCGYEFNPKDAAPGPNSQPKTYSNSCSACANAKIAGYKPGACPED